MSLSERESKGVIELFVKTFTVSKVDERRDVYLDFADSFLGTIKQWNDLIYETFEHEGISKDIIIQWQELEAERKLSRSAEVCEICKMTMADESQIVKLLTKEFCG